MTSAGRPARQRSPYVCGTCGHAVTRLGSENRHARGNSTWTPDVCPDKPPTVIRRSRWAERQEVNA